jgi:signal transduction histidine kinase
MTMPISVPAVTAANRGSYRGLTRLGGVAVAGTAWGLLTLWPDLVAGSAAAVVCLVATVSFSVVGAALTLTLEPALRPAGRALAVAGALAPLNSAMGWNLGPLPYLTGFSEGVFWIAVAWAVLACQGLRLERPDCALLITLCAYFVGGQFVWCLVSRPEWLGFPPDAWWPVSYPDRAWSSSVESVLGVVALLSAAAFVARVLVRTRSVSRLDAHASAPVALAAGVCTVGAAVAWAATGRVTVLDQALLLGVPIAFGVSAVRARLLRAQLAVALVELSRTPTLSAVEALVRRSLRDDTAKVHYWVPERSTFVDTEGRAVPPAAEGEGRLRVPLVTAQGAPLAVVTTDASLARHRDFVETTVRSTGTVIENARLQAIVQAQLTALREAQGRVVQVGLEERRRLERDLHDGAQQRLLSVAGDIGLAATQTDDADRRSTLGRAGDDLRTALRELRELAHGLHPVILTRDGLGPAVRDVAARLPLPVDVVAEGGRFPSAIESTAYFVICEALANTVKHAGAAAATVQVRAGDKCVLIDVADDGVGGANITGSGLQGLRDRVETIGGTLTLTSPMLAGTKMHVRLPD